MPVYIVEAVGLGLVKIGKANDVAARLGGLQTSCPVPLKVIRVFDGGFAEERVLHRMFADDRSHGEWFSASIVPKILALDWIDATFWPEPGPEPQTPFGHIARMCERIARKAGL